MVDNPWRWLCELALAEIDPAKKAARFKAVEEAMHARVIVLGGQISRDDLPGIRDVSSNLHTLKQEWKQSSVRELRNRN